MSGNPVKKILLVLAGSLSLALGILGIFLPLLPTTPFLLLASFCYMRSSKRLYIWLINHKTFGEYIYNYVTHRAVKRSAKITALVVLWLSMTTSIVLVDILYVRILLIAIGTAVSIHILSLKTFDSSMGKKTEGYPELGKQN